jgi:hypothetical protein
MAANRKLTKVIKGRVISGASQADEALEITFDDGSKMKIKTAPSTSQAAATGGKILKVRQRGGRTQPRPGRRPDGDHPDRRGHFQRHAPGQERQAGVCRLRFRAKAAGSFKFASFALGHLLDVSLWALLWCVIASFRWSGLPLALSLGISAGAALQGWRLGWRIGAKLDDARIARLLIRLRIEDPPEWALFPRQEQEIQAMHLSRCSKRWGINARSSGWEVFCRSWRRDAAFLLGCAALAVHPWWFAL